MPVYRTGRTRTFTYRIDFSGDCGRRVEDDYILGSGMSFFVALPAGLHFEGKTLGGNFVLSGSGGTLSYPLPDNGIETITGYINVSFEAEEAVEIIVLPTEWYDEAGEPDYPLSRRMRVFLLIADSVITIEQHLRNLSNTTTIYKEYEEISGFGVTQDFHMGCSMSLYPYIEYNLTHSNSAYLGVKWNGRLLPPRAVSDSRDFSYPPITYHEEIYTSDNGINGATTITINGEVPFPEEGDYYAQVNYLGSSNPIKGCDVKIKAYNLTQPNTEPIPITIFGRQVDVRDEYTQSFNGLEKYYIEYNLQDDYGDKNGIFQQESENYDRIRIHSDYRFMFRTFLYDTITAYNYTEVLPVGDYLGITKYTPIRNVRIADAGGKILMEQQQGSETALVEYNIGQFYMDSHRYLRLRLEKYQHDDITITLHINNKLFSKTLTLPPTGTQDVYFDLCYDEALDQQVDLKNNNFNEDDSYARFWGITKTTAITFEFTGSFYLHEIKLSASRPDLQRGEKTMTFLPTPHTWQAGKRRGIVARAYGKQTLELPDADQNGEISIAQVYSEMNSDRWNGWSITPRNFNTGGCSGQVQNLNPCYLNLDRPASFIHGGGNTYNGQTDTNWVNTTEPTFVAQVLVDEIEYYPDCGDVFWQTTNSGNLRVYASVIRRGQANGIFFVGSDVKVKLTNATDYAGDDQTDDYEYYYIIGKGARHGEEYQLSAEGASQIAERMYHDRNEYRICVLDEVKQHPIISDIFRERTTVLSTTYMGDVGVMLQYQPCLDTYTRKDEKATTCFAHALYRFYGLRTLELYNTDFTMQTSLGQIVEENDMYPFARRIFSNFFVTSYNPNTKNFDVRVFNNAMENEKTYRSVLEKDADEDIPEQNFPIDDYYGTLIGVYYSTIGSTRYITLVASSDWGASWERMKRIKV